MSAPKQSELIEELSKEPVNILRVKILCRENPGLIASAGLRIKIWTLLLLGSASANDLNKDIGATEKDCDEQQVLDADVHRTRADVEDFRTTAWRLAVRNILKKFCLSHSVQYKQGMNEVCMQYFLYCMLLLILLRCTYFLLQVLAPFLFLLPPPNGSLHPYSLFEAFLFRYLERFTCLDDSSHLFKAFRLFHLLLLYFDPQLAQHLHEQDFPPELYSPQWFLTLYSRSLPLPHVLRLWDMVIATDDPSFTFFIGMCLLRRKRTELLLADRDRIPEIIVHMHFHGEEEIDAVVTEARALYRATPRCFLRHLRLCCVSTTELMPQPVLFQTRHLPAAYSLNVHEFDRHLSLQADRSVLMLSTQELVNSVAPIQVTGNTGSYRGNSGAGTGESSDIDSGSGGGGGGGSDGSASDATPLQYVLIDIRAFEDTIQSGGGVLPRAIQLEPEFLQRPDAFDIWLQHFDGTRGCNICIIDLPPAKWSGVALWRRLLLGEGDGTAPSASSGRSTELPAAVRAGRQQKGNSSSNSSHKDGSSSSGAGGKEQRRDLQSSFAVEEAEIARLDLARPAVQLALALQAHSFPNVTVLDGGFPALVEQLIASRGSVEPVIINHDEVQWARFLRTTGRDYKTLEKSRRSSQSSVNSANSVSRNADSAPAYEKRRTVRDLSKFEVYRYALRVADRLQHTHMRGIIAEKVEKLQQQQAAATESQPAVGVAAGGGGGSETDGVNAATEG